MSDKRRAPPMIQPERLRWLNDEPARAGRFVLLWIQAAQRARCNHALEHAIDRANELALPLVAVFGLTESFPEANERSYAFMLEGLAGLSRRLGDRGVQLVLRRGNLPDAVLPLVEDAALVVADMGYLRIQRAWRRQLAKLAPCRVEQVETDAVVPVETAAPREAYAAATLRPRIHRLLPRFLAPLRPRGLRKDSLGLRLDGLDLHDHEALLAGLSINRSVGRVAAFAGGEDEAHDRLQEFLDRKLRGYATRRNDPALDHTSQLSPYLHFGQISPLEVTLAVRESRGKDGDAFLEELIVRRELSLNFCWWNPRYDRFACLPDWASTTLARHSHDARPVVYSARALERAETHDEFWNAAQLEMTVTGKMHNYMRMYWGKKILEWTKRPEDAFRIALRLNNKYELDGRDPNSFAGVAWVFGKHDRPWGERPIYGLVRTMTESGLRRKFDIGDYVERIRSLRPDAVDRRLDRRP